MNDNSLKFLQIGEGAERRAIAVREQHRAPRRACFGWPATNPT